MSVMQAPASEQYRDSLKWPQYRKPTHEEWNAEVTALRTELAAIKAAQPEPMSDERINELWAWSGEPEAERTATTRHHAFAYALLSAQPDGWVSVPDKVPDSFTEWLCHEIPEATVISNPSWWAPRLWNAMKRCSPPRRRRRDDRS